MFQNNKNPLWQIILKWFLGLLGCLLLLYILLVLLSIPAVLEEERRVEARHFTSGMAKVCGTFFKKDDNTDGCGLQNLSVENFGVPPASCMPTHNFWYSVKDLGDSKVSFIATRCSQGGRNPLLIKKPYHIILTVDYKCGTNFECSDWQHDYGKFTF